MDALYWYARALSTRSPVSSARDALLSLLHQSKLAGDELLENYDLQSQRETETVDMVSCARLWL